MVKSFKDLLPDYVEFLCDIISLARRFKVCNIKKCTRVEAYEHEVLKCIKKRKRKEEPTYLIRAFKLQDLVNQAIRLKGLDTNVKGTKV